jgi:hypothetical protein
MGKKEISSVEKSIWQDVPLKQREKLSALLSSILLSKPKENNNELTSQNTAYTPEPSGRDLCSSILCLSSSKQLRKPEETICLEGSGSEIRLAK